MNGLLEEEESLRLATALSLSERQEKQITVNTHLSLHEDENLHLALVLSETLFEAQQAKTELEEAIPGLRINQEEVDFEVALAMEAAANLETRQQDMVETGYLIDLQLEDDEINGGQHIAVAEEETFRLRNLFPNERQTPVREPFDFELPEMYQDYRLVPTKFSEKEMWPCSAICKQQRELRLSGHTETVTQWREGQSESDRCLVCLSNVATQVAVPCGHRLCCRTCLLQLTDKSFYYSVTAPDGQVVPTDRRLPVQCFVCRAIVAQTVVVR